MAGRPGTVTAGRGSSRAGIRVAAMSATAAQNVWPNAAASASGIVALRPDALLPS